MLKCFNTIIYLLLLTGIVQAQTAGMWQRKVSISASEEPISNLLFELSDQADFDFSFDARLVPGEMRISVNMVDQELGSAVDEIAWKAGVKYTIKKNHVIFFKEKTPPAKTYQVLAGSVRDRESGKPVAHVSVVEPYLLIGAVTNDSGRFELEVPNPKYTIFLEFRKTGYQVRKVNLKMDEDNTIYLQMQSLSKSDTSSEIKQETTVLKPEEISVPVVKAVLTTETDTSRDQRLQQSIFDEGWVRSFTSEKYRNSVEEDSSLRYFPFQLSLTPGLSTNLNLAHKTINRGASVNVLIGLSAGTIGAEAGGLVNINRFNMRGAQVAGLANIVGGHMNGVQAAGLVNKTKKKGRGVQVAGLSNITGLSFEGVQASGLSNTIRGTLLGVQASGFRNHVTSDIQGIQLAGFSNNGNETINGMQVAGVSNTSKRKIRGMQIAGLVNLAESVKGAQVAGLLNYSHKLDGFQLGFVNVVDSLQRGTSFGFFSLVKNGYRRHELSSNPEGLLHYHFKSGTNTLYNIFGAGIMIQSDPMIWDFGYGIGTMIRPEKRIFGNVEVICYSIQNPGWMNQLNLLNRLNTNLGFKLYKRFAVVAGPSFNVYLAHKDLARFAELTNEKTVQLDLTSDELLIKGWVELNVGIQF